MIRAAIVAALLAMLAGCDRGDQHQAVTCGPTAASCLILYEDGRLLKAIKDPPVVQPTPYGSLMFQEADGTTYVWSGAYLWRVGRADL